MNPLLCFNLHLGRIHRFSIRSYSETNSDTVDTGADHALNFSRLFGNHSGNGGEVHESVAETPRGKAVFALRNSSSAELQIEYSVVRRTRTVAEGSLMQAIEDLCQQEIADMRTTLHSLGAQISRQLPETGLAPRIRERWRYADDREWIDEGTTFTIETSKTRMRKVFNGTAELANATFVRSVVDLLVHHREVEIRDLYKKILDEATFQRAQRRTAEVGTWLTNSPLPSFNQALVNPGHERSNMTYLLPPEQK